MSLVVERRAPAPANAGMSQLDTGSSARLCPLAIRACRAGVRATVVSFIPSGAVTRVRMRVG